MYWADLLLTGDGGYLREGELQQDLLLVIHHVHPRPVDGDDDVILGQVGTGVAEGLVEPGIEEIELFEPEVVLYEPGEEERPLVLGVAHNVLLCLQSWHILLDVVALKMETWIEYKGETFFKVRYIETKERKAFVIISRSQVAAIKITTEQSEVTKT